MIGSKIMYVLMFFVSVIFFILYTKPYSLYLMLFIAAIPVFLFIVILLAKRMIKADIEVGSDTAVKNEKIDISVNIKNRLSVPFTNSIISIEYYNSLVGVKDIITVSVPIHAMCSEKIYISLSSDYCGILNMKIKSIRVYDPIKLFSCRICPKKERSITVLPEICPVSSMNSFSLINSDESEIFSKHKSGDDPSEIFALKDYIPGDRPNRIHWNLSLKHDDIIVRHYSQPVNSSIAVVFDFCGVPGIDAKALDTAADTVFSIAFFFIDNGIPFKFIYYSQSAGGEISAEISDEKDISHVIKDIFKKGSCVSTSFALDETAREHSGIFYVTTSQENLFNALSLVDGGGLRPIFIESENSSVSKFESYNDITVIPAGNSSRFISDILI